MIESLLPFFFALWQCNKKFDKSKPECTTPHLNEDNFNAKYKSYEDRFEAVRAKVEKLQKVRAERQAKSDSISAFMFELHEADEPITEFDDRLWLAVIDVAIVRHDGMLVFRFRNGLEIEA